MMNSAATATGQAWHASPAPGNSIGNVQGPPIPLAHRWLAAYDGAMGPAVDMSQAVPAYDPSPFFTHRFVEAATAPTNARYGPIFGNDALRAAYAADVTATYGAAVDAGAIAITAGCNQAFFVAAMAVAQAGQSVLLPTPWYFNHQMTLAMLGIDAVPVPTAAAQGFIPSPEAVLAAMRPDTRALVLVSPNNPTGAVSPPDAIEALYELCLARGLHLILDETYRDFLPPSDTPPHRLFARADWQDRLVALYSFSKSYAIPGHRLGAMAAGPAILESAEKILDSMQICPSRPSQAALAPSIAATGEWRAEKAAAIRARAGLFRTAMGQAPRWRVEQMGAYFAYVRHPYPGVPSGDVAAALAGRLGLLTLPGSFFGPGQDEHLRLAFANVDEAGIARFAERLARHGDELPVSLYEGARQP